MDDAKLLAALRSICARWPEVTETVTFGANPTFKAGRKAFAVVDRYQGVRCLCVRAPDSADRARRLRDRRYFEPPYDPGKAWIALRTDGIRAVAELRELCEASYRSAALKRMLVALDEGAAAPRRRRAKP